MLSKNSIVEGISNILICEDHSFVQLGIELSLKKILHQIRSLHVASSGKDAIELVKKQKPDLVMMDLGLPDMTGLQTIIQIKLLYPEVMIFVLTGTEDRNLLSQVKDCGVSAIMQKASSFEILGTAIEEYQKTKSLFLDPRIKSILQVNSSMEFTPREYEILIEITKGRSNTQIAEKFGYSVTTVRFHKSNIMEKANVRNAAELTAWFLQRKC